MRVQRRRAVAKTQERCWKKWKTCKLCSLVTPHCEKKIGGLRDVPKPEQPHAPQNTKMLSTSDIYEAALEGQTQKLASTLHTPLQTHVHAHARTHTHKQRTRTCTQSAAHHSHAHHTCLPHTHTRVRTQHTLFPEWLATGDVANQFLENGLTGTCVLWPSHSSPSSTLFLFTDAHRHLSLVPFLSS